MRRLVPSMQVRDELILLPAGSTEAETNVVSGFLELAVRLVTQQLLSGRASRLAWWQRPLRRRRRGPAGIEEWL